MGETGIDEACFVPSNAVATDGEGWLSSGAGSAALKVREHKYMEVRFREALSQTAMNGKNVKFTFILY